jgi:5'-nucleotidase
VRILITNDDGIDAEGIGVLARTFATGVADDGHEVVVVAPDRDWSGAGAALGTLRPDVLVEARAVEIPGLDAAAYAVGGPPGMCVLSARLGAFGAPPDLVVSGVNIGLNTGRAILHSGTVGAALTAQNFGFSGLAVSVQSADPRFDTAAQIALELLPLLLAAPERSVLNLNVPGRARADVRGVRWAKLAPFGEVRAAVASTTDTHLQFELRMNEVDFDDDTDEGLVRDGYAAVTALVGIAEAWPRDDEGELASGDVESRLVPGAPVEAVEGLASPVLRRPLLSAGVPPER